MKTCTSCGERKLLADFYGAPGNTDGRAGKCKECTKRDVAANRLAKLERYRAYDRDRAKLPHRIAVRKAVAAARAESPEARTHDLASRDRWRDRNQVKRRAHIMVGNAIKYGHLKAPTACDRCGEEKAVEAHHEDYYKPLEVTWLCEDCHGLRHREINEMIRNGVDLRCRGFEPAGTLSAAA